MAQQCCFLNCGIRKDTQLYFFPKPSENVALFEEWVDIIGGDLLHMDYETIYENYFICGKHFQYLALKKYETKPDTVCDKKRKSKKKVKTTPDSITNFEEEEIEDPLGIKMELQSESDDMDGSETHNADSDSENLPLITHVKSEALDISSDGYDLPWNEELHNDNLESEPTARDNEITNKQINEQSDISEPTAKAFKIENDCENDMPGVLDENEEIETNTVKEGGMKQVNVMTKIHNLPDNIGCELSKQKQQSYVNTPVSNAKLGPAKKLYIPISVNKQDNVTNILKKLLCERRGRPGFSDKSTPMNITKVTSDIDPRPHVQTPKTQLFTPPKLNKAILSSDGVKSILDKLLRNLAIQETSAAAAELAHSANLVYLEHERMIDIIRSYQRKNNLFQTKIRSLENQLKVTTDANVSLQQNLNSHVLNTYNTASEMLTYDMPIKLRNLIKMQLRLSKTRRTSGEEKFLLKDNEFAWQLYKRSEKTYNYLRKVLILPSPKLITAYQKHRCRHTDLLSGSSDGEGSNDDLNNDTGTPDPEALVNVALKNEKNNSSSKRVRNDSNLVCKGVKDDILVCKGITDDDNLASSVTKDNKLVFNSSTEQGSLSENIDFEDELDREKWVIKKVPTKKVVSDKACVSGNNNGKAVFTISNQVKVIKLPAHLKNANLRRTFIKNNMQFKIIERKAPNAGTTLKEPNTLSTLSIHKKKQENTLQTVKINDHLRETKTDYDSESTLSANEVFDEYSENYKEAKKRLEPDLKNEPADRRTKTFESKKKNAKDIDKMKSADELKTMKQAQLSSDNVKSRKRRKKEIDIAKAEVTIDSEDESLSTYSRRHSSRLALKRKSRKRLSQ